ncbi:MAG TPA: DUF72 domain-containing protein [Vicinamibacterales bacterium]|nr:DUF72 domain-containing protein [Vicinamibacterales bacterium]
MGGRVRAEIRIGCSGWNYQSWRGRFYPRELPPTRWLSFYSERFDTVEVNNTFYRLPERATFAAWARQVPRTFVFAVKASRFLTHMKRLRDPDEPLARLFSRAVVLKRHLGPVLYQLPARFTRDAARLDAFLAALPGNEGGTALHHVVEFRDPSWYVEETFGQLEAAGVALCLHDKDGSAIRTPFVGPVAYVRFHGPTGHYAGRYPRRRLDAWAERLGEQARLGRPVYAYFNNDPDAAAPADAVVLRDALAPSGDLIGAAG